MYDRSELQRRLHGLCFHTPQIGFDRIHHKPVVHWTGGGGKKHTVPITELTGYTIAELEKLLADHAASEELLAEAGNTLLHQPNQTTRDALLTAYLVNIATLEQLPEKIRETKMHKPALVVALAMNDIAI